MAGSDCAGLQAEELLVLAERDDASRYSLSPLDLSLLRGSSITAGARAGWECEGWLSLFAKCWCFSFGFRAPVSHNGGASLQPTPQSRQTRAGLDSSSIQSSKKHLLLLPFIF